MKMVTPDQLVWKDHPVFKGVQVVVLIGDPAKAGELYVLRAKYPPNYQLAPHTHLGDETLEVACSEFVGRSNTLLSDTSAHHAPVFPVVRCD